VVVVRAHLPNDAPHTERKHGIPRERQKEPEQACGDVEEETQIGERRILTPVDEPIIVLLISLCAVSFPLEMHGCDTFGFSGSIVVKRDFTKGADSRVEKLLKGPNEWSTTVFKKWKKERQQHTLIWASLTS
jgi:hypothetical protein